MTARPVCRRVWTWSATRVATAGVLAELPLVGLGLWLWGASQPVPDGEPGPQSPALAVFALPVLLPFAAVLALVLAVTVVLPTTALARRAGAWWWVPVAAAVPAAVVVAAAGAAIVALGGSLAEPAALLGWWLAT
ncbi:hypothetical protein AB0K09_33345, partial [Streptomyces sp. NPDC049577]